MTNYFDKSPFSCSHPVVLKTGQVVPCGKCINCRKNKVNEWARRMQLEFASCGQKALFCTLTYREPLPSPTLRKEDMQKFMKRFRYFLAKYNLGKVSVFYSGEYGERFNRPHFHLIIFNLPFFQGVVKMIHDCWKFGFVKVYKAECRHFYYCAKYCVKQFAKEVDGVKEFVGMSRARAIGSDYVNNNLQNIIDSGLEIDLFGHKFFCPKTLLRRNEELKSLLRFIRKKVCFFVVPDNFDFDIDLKKQYLNYFLFCQTHNTKNLYPDCQDFRLLRFSDFKYIIDGNVKKELMYCFRRHYDRFTYYSDNKILDYVKFNYYSPYIIPPHDYDTGEVKFKHLDLFVIDCPHFFVYEYF